MLCTHCGANLSAGRRPSHFATGCGGRQRSSPTGGVAKGTPLKTVRPSSFVPCNWPCSTDTVVFAARLIHGTATIATASKNDLIVQFPLFRKNARTSGGRGKPSLQQSRTQMQSSAQSETLPILLDLNNGHIVQFFTVNDRNHRFIEKPVRPSYW